MSLRVNNRPQGLNRGLSVYPSSGGGFSPLSLPNLYLWTPGGDANYVVVSSAVNEWLDQSGNGRNFGQYSGTQYPDLASSAGKPLIDSVDVPFFAGNAALLTAVTPTPATFASMSIFVVAYTTTISSAFSRLLEQSYNAGFYLGTDTTGTELQFIVNDSGIGTVAGGTLVDNTPFLVSATFDETSGDAVLQQNGTTVATGTFTAPSSSSPQAIALGRPSPAVGGPGQWSGGVGEIAIYTDTKAGGDLTNLNNYFINKYAIS